MRSSFICFDLVHISFIISVDLHHRTRIGPLSENLGENA